MNRYLGLPTSNQDHELQAVPQHNWPQTHGRQEKPNTSPIANNNQHNPADLILRRHDTNRSRFYRFSQGKVDDRVHPERSNLLYLSRDSREVSLWG